MTVATIADAERALARLDAVARRFDLSTVDVAAPPRLDDLGPLADRDEVAAFIAAMDDDLDTPRAVAVLFALATKANALADAGGDEAALQAARVLRALAGSVGLALDGSGTVLDAPTAALAEARDAARERGDYAEADRLRDRLEALGLVVEDSVEGTKVRRA